MPFRHALRALLGRSWHILRDRRVRSEWLTRLRYRGRVHQDTSLSWIDRYPRLFAAARDLLIVEHALYRAEDVLDPLAFEAIGGAGNWLAKGPRFAPDGRRITPQPTIARIFRRR